MKHIISKRNRTLLAELVRTDFKIRYQNSVLGYAWSLLRPLFLFIILYVVFVKFMNIGSSVPHFSMALLFGIMLWNFFVETTSQSLTSIVARGDLIRKIKIPRWLIVASSSISALINLLLNGVVLVIFMAISGVGVSDRLILLPVVLVELYIFSLGISFFLSTAYVKYRDVTYIWEVILNAGFYAAPILYPLSKIPSETFQKLIMLNPVAQIIQDAKYIVISPQITTGHNIFQGGWLMFIPYMIVVLVVFVGASYFRRESKYFAENI